jgi:porphobilinogen synthase
MFACVNSQIMATAVFISCRDYVVSLILTSFQGILEQDGRLNNQKSIERLAQVSLAYGQAGAHIVAPSDMMDNRIGAIKAALINAGIANKVSVMAYSAKFASSFYGPFR